MVVRQHVPVVVTALGGVTTVLGTFLPWLRSGARNRSSYAIFDLVERLGFAPDGPVAWSLRLWPLVPLLAIGTAVASWAVVHERAPRLPVVVSAALLTLWVGGTSLAVTLAPDVGLFRIGLGPWVTLAGTFGLASGGVLLASRSFRRPGSGSSAAS